MVLVIIRFLYPEGYSETLGELSVEIKDSISHRKKCVN